MSLLAPYRGFNAAWDNCTQLVWPLSGSDGIEGVISSVGATGRDVTAGANNTDGTAVGLFRNNALTEKNLPFDCHYLVLGIGGFNGAAANAQTLVDLLIDPAGGTSYSVLISGLIGGMTPNHGPENCPNNLYHFPLWIPSGAKLGIRARTRHTATRSGNVVAYVFGEPVRPDTWWCGSNVETLGLNASVSQGTDIPDDAAASAWSSWTDVGSPTSYRYGCLQMGINGSDGTASSGNYWFQPGYGSNPVPGFPPIVRHLNTSEVGVQCGQIAPFWCDIPAGTQMQARQTCSAASGETLNVALYGVY